MFSSSTNKTEYITITLSQSKMGTWGPFLEGPEKFSHPERHSKILNLLITELFYSHILNMNRSFPSYK